MEFVTFETSKNLKEKGFPFVDYIPTISQALDWLREEKGIHVGIVVWEKGWYFDVWSFEPGEEENEYETHNRYVSEDYKSYKEAALAGIEYVLDELI